MSGDEIIQEQPLKKRKLENGSEANTNSDVTESESSQEAPLESMDAAKHINEETTKSPEPITISQDKFRNLVTAEELERLRQFHVLDEVKSNDEDSNDENSDDSDGKSEDLPDDEIERMLEEDLPDEIKGAPKTREKAFVTRQKIVLEEKGVNHFEVLPLDWIMVRHMSGMPIYMHRGTRVCTLSKPYFLGRNNTRRHDIPISAIPCFAYRRALEEEEKQKEIDKKIQEQIRNGTWALNNNQKTGGNETRSKTDLSNGTDNTKTVLQATTEQQSIPESINKETPDNTDQEISKAPPINPDITDEQISEVTDQEMPEPTAKQVPTTTNQEPTPGVSSVTNEEEIPESTTAEPDSSEKLMNDISLTETAIMNEKSLERSERKCPFSKASTSAEEPRVNGSTSEEPAVVNEQIPLSRQPVVLPGGIMMPPPRVETINTSWKTQHLTSEQINDYCKKLFKFKVVHIMHFKRWADRRKYTKARRTLQYPTLPEGTKLITIPAQPAAPGQDTGGKSTKRDWVMNMNDRSYLSVFHEYVRRALQKQPIYHFRQLENASAPYQAIVYIGGMQYGVGYGSSKRQAKSAAARASIHILIPEMKDELDAADPAHAPDKQPDFHDFFDLVGIEDPRITEFCAATCEPSPHAILRTCLLRNFGAGDRHIHTEMKKLEFQKIELTMKVGKHTASVICKNKKTAKQRASQAILQALHPHVRSWGSLLRLYGSKSVKSCKEKKLEEQQITLLQDKARHNEPNYAVLEKLRHEMKKLRERDEAVVPIGTLLVKDDLPTHSGSNLNNVDL